MKRRFISFDHGDPAAVQCPVLRIPHSVPIAKQSGVHVVIKLALNAAPGPQPRQVPELALYGDNVQNRAGPEPILEHSRLKWPGVQCNLFGCPVKCRLRELAHETLLVITRWPFRASDNSRPVVTTGPTISLTLGKTAC